MNPNANLTDRPLRHVSCCESCGDPTSYPDPLCFDCSMSRAYPVPGDYIAPAAPLSDGEDTP